MAAVAKRAIKSRSAALEAVRENGQALKSVSDQLRGDRKVVLEAVRQNARALQFASQELRADREVTLEAVRGAGQALRFAAEALQADRELVLEAVKKDGMALDYASEALRADRQVVLEAVRCKPIALSHASEDLRNDRALVLEAARLDGTSFEYASRSLRADRAAVLEAAAADGRALDHAAEELQSDRSFLLEVLGRNGRALEHLDEALRVDRSAVLAAVSQSGLALEHAAAELRGDREVVLEAVRQDGAALAHASEELCADHGVVLEAVKQSPAALDHAATELRNDRQIAAEAALTEWEALRAKEADVDPQGPVFAWAPEEICEDEEEEDGGDGKGPAGRTASNSPRGDSYSLFDFEAVEDRSPRSSAALAELRTAGDRAFREGSYEEALRTYGEVLQLRPGSGRLLLNRAAAQLMLGSFQQAYEDAAAAATRLPSNARAQERCAKCLLLLDRLQESVEFSEGQLRHVPQAHADRLAWSPFLCTSSRVRLHLEKINEIDKLLEDRSRARTEQAVTACIRDVERMLMLLTQLESTSPWGRRLRLAAVRALLLPLADYSQETQRAWSQGALEHALQLVEEAPDEPRGRHWQARCLLSLGRREEARAALREAAASTGGHAASEELLDGLRVAEAERQRGEAALERKEHEAAHRHFDAAVAADRDHPDPDFAAALLCGRSAAGLRLGRAQQTVDDACEALSLAPGYTKALFHRGVALFEMEQYEAAFADFSQVSERAPSFKGIGEWKIRARTWAKKKPRTNHYAVLGAPAGADAAEIKRAYKAAALRWHPDKNPDRRQEAERKFKEVSEAFEVLSDPKKKREYDSTGKVSEPRPHDPRHADSGFGFGPGRGFGGPFGGGLFGSRGRGPGAGYPGGGFARGRARGQPPWTRR